MAEEGGWRPKVVRERLHRWRWQKKVDGDLKLSGRHRWRWQNKVDGDLKLSGRDVTGGDGRRRWMET